MSEKKQILVPDLGGAGGAVVIELFVKHGDTIAIDDPVLLLEGDKATMEVPSPVAGVIESLALKEGDKVNTGDVMMYVQIAGEPTATAEKSEKAPVIPVAATALAAQSASPEVPKQAGTINAGPAVRRLAHVLEVNLADIRGSGRAGRILTRDVYTWIKSRHQVIGGQAASSMPDIDFSVFGEIEKQPLHKIKQMTGRHLSISWQTVPHVTQFHEVDITELEAFRQANKAQVAEQGGRLTPLVFIMKATIDSLQKFPNFNSSLDVQNKQLILKKYFNIGIAVETPDGLVVPVVRDVDKKEIIPLTKELVEVSRKARKGQLDIKAMQGGSITISSLGGLGVGSFTPVVNIPEVAILGVGKAEIKPVYQNDNFVPRLMLPLCLSYDHRVIDGAEGARFIIHLASCLCDIRNLLL